MDNETKEMLDLILRTLNDLNLSVIKVNNALKELKTDKKEDLFI